MEFTRLEMLPAIAVLALIAQVALVRLGYAIHHMRRRRK